MIAAHSAYNFEEMAKAIQESFKDIDLVAALVKFVQWSVSLEANKVLNVARNTPGICSTATTSLSRLSGAQHSFCSPR